MSHRPRRTRADIHRAAPTKATLEDLPDMEGMFLIATFAFEGLRGFMAAFEQAEKGEGEFANDPAKAGHAVIQGCRYVRELGDFLERNVAQIPAYARKSFHTWHRDMLAETQRMAVVLMPVFANEIKEGR